MSPDRSRFMGYFGAERGDLELFGQIIAGLPRSPIASRLT